MKPALLLLIATILLTGCEPSFKEEYEATLKQLESTQKELAQTKEKLRAADNEIRHKIFSLIRKSNKHLQTTTLDPAVLDQLEQEMRVHIDSYAQFRDSANHVSVTAGFYAGKLNSIRELLIRSRSAYDRRFNECLTTLEASRDGKELGTMLCEVQADLARRDMATRLDGEVKSLLFIANKQVQAGRQVDSSDTSMSELEQEFRVQMEKHRQEQSG